MSISFRGIALPLDQKGLYEVIDCMGVTAAELWAVLTVETRGCGFLPDRRPLILFERHIFSRETEHWFDESHPDLSNKQPGGYGATGAAQYQRLERALQLDRQAALRSTSWGIGQVMGFNAMTAGYRDTEALVEAITISENEQLRAMMGQLMHNGLHRALRAHDWVEFARGYNGPAYVKNRYDLRLAAAYQKYALGPLPDLVVRAAQIYLTYLGYHPGPIDGVPGRFTYAALNEFQLQHGLPMSSEIDEELLLMLKEKALAGDEMQKTPSDLSKHVLP